MSVPAPVATKFVEEHPIDTLLRADRFPHILCPACGIGSVIHSYVQAISESNIDKTQHVCVSGIGCSGRAAGYINVDSYHTTHGRAVPFAFGIAVYRPELCVTVISGDGDLSSIGGNHLIHAARRNVNLTVICINNFNYGMTGGQAGPTTPASAKSSTTPFGSWERPFNLAHLAHAVGASLVSRWTVLHTRQLKQTILKAMQKRGFAFIEVLSPCPTGFGRPNDRGDGLEDMRRYRQRCVIDDDAYLPDIDIDIMDDTKPIVVGNFVNVDRPPFLPVLGAPRHEIAKVSAEKVNQRTKSRESIDNGH